MTLVNKEAAYKAMERGAKVVHLDLLEENPSHFYQFDGKSIRDENGIMVDPHFFEKFADDIDCWRVLETSWQVPFQAEESVWNNCVAIVSASTKEEAYNQIKKEIKTGGNPFSLDIPCDWAGVNTVTDEVFETSKYSIGEEYSSSLEDVKPHYAFPYKDKRKAYQNAIATSVKLTLEIDINSLDVDVLSILQGLDAELTSDGTNKYWKQYSIQTLRETLNDDTDDEFKDVFYGVWSQFVNYCIQQNADYVLLRKV